MPRIVDRDERRREICDVLLDIVAEVGIAGATIRAVADRSGWSTGVIGHYFRDRRDLLLGGMRRAGDIGAEYAKGVLSNMSGLQAIELLLENLIPIDRRRLALNRIFLFFYAEALRNDELRREIESYLLDWRKAVARAVHRAQDSGDLPKDLDPKQVAQDLVGMADGLSIHAMFDQEIMARMGERPHARFWIARLRAGMGAARPAPASAPPAAFSVGVVKA
jgi:AcrR family transcriptional regulator